MQANIQAAYTKHRMTRNAEQASGLLSHEFEGMTLDPILSDLLDPLWPEYVDPRNSIVFWARPPGHILELAQVLGERLKEVFPGAHMSMSISLLVFVHKVGDLGVP